MTITLFYSPFCPPARFVLLVAKALRLKLKIEEVNLVTEKYKLCSFKKEHPEKTIPCLKDGNDYIWDSHAIAGYLVKQYGHESNLIPRNLIQNAKVERFLHFDSEYLTPLTCDILVPILFHRRTSIAKPLKKSVENIYSVLDKHLENCWLTGNKITLADLCCISSISTLNLIVPVGEKTKLFGYMQKFEKLPYYKEGNQNGLNTVAEVIMDRIVFGKFRVYS